ncbi:hypothetical protein MA20_41915 [Bradyrhizobium japonicum]|uniref:PepSY domain-containing protein n=1 Tax=Bradyrhizobium japonicum TaxID=375 RepID=A0A0A3XHH3_BRAJP|nr:hypothetical protein MA20_41915 [Bradyrhizobium japonicum]
MRLFGRAPLTQGEIEAKLRAAGCSQIQEVPSGKIETYRAIKESTERSLIVDSTGHIKELR